MPGKSDFFLVGEGLAPIQTALDEAQLLRRIVRRVLAISLGYNVFAITAALFGVMSPVAAAISMPTSTLTLLLITVTSLRRREAPRRDLPTALPLPATAGRDSTSCR
jgi:Cu2+-exporting ATPase